jgi:hypothetical protein
MLINHGIVNSSMLASASYDTETHEMTIEFNNGKSYIYTDVDRRTFEELIGAKSAGKYFNLIKKNLKVKVQ